MLSFHVDDSDVTINVCLGREFEGGDLLCHGQRCELHCKSTPPLPELNEGTRVSHKVGQAIIHIGKHRHAALPITAGERSNLILWCRCSAFADEERRRRGTCPEWCGWNGMQNQAQPEEKAVDGHAAADE